MPSLEKDSGHSPASLRGREGNSDRRYSTSNRSTSTDRERSLERRERVDRLVRGGKLNPEEILLLKGAKGENLHVHLQHFELWDSSRASKAHPAYPYTAVNVLLLDWEEDDLGVASIIPELFDVFHNAFGFDAACYSIPSERSYQALESQLQQFKQRFSSEGRLLIVYYNGHGYLDLQNRLHLAAKR